MAVEKKTKRGLCPFSLFEECNPDCAFYRKGVRFAEKTSEPIPFEDCAINIIADNLEAMHNRTYMMQKEVGDTKNIMAMKTMVDLGIKQENHKEALVRQLVNILDPPDPKKAIE